MVFSRAIALILVGSIVTLGPALSTPSIVAPPPPGEQPALPDNLIDQTDIQNGLLSLTQIRRAGGIVFTTAFNRFDGMGDGPPEIFDATQTFPFRGDRPTLQTSNSKMLRINGLDAQSCQECHSVVSRAVVPFSLGIAGHGGINNSAMPGTNTLDATASNGLPNGITHTSGRVINPPFLYGAGGIELLAKEMTRDLQAIKEQTQNEPAGTVRNLVTKDVNFGTVTSTGIGNPALVEIDNELGIDEDLVVRPFGRKGENFTIRDFDRTAMAFHLGIQPVEVFDPGTDPDGDGVADELSIGEMSALSIFLATTPRPRTPILKGNAIAGKQVFESIGCADCHIPELHTNSNYLTQSFPDIADTPDANVFIRINLSRPPANFERLPQGGLSVPLFADLKRHNMGAELAESTGSEMDPFFTTARLWGIADSAPYLHDGRADTLTEAILAHGGEARKESENFEKLGDQEKIELLAFLRSLKVPTQKDVNKLTKLIRGKNIE